MVKYAETNCDGLPNAPISAAIITSVYVFEDDQEATSTWGGTPPSMISALSDPVTETIVAPGELVAAAKKASES